MYIITRIFSVTQHVMRDKSQTPYSVLFSQVELFGTGYLHFRVRVQDSVPKNTTCRLQYVSMIHAM